MRINQYELIKLYNDCVDKRDFINSCIDKYSIETSAWENYWDLIDATIDREAPPSKAESAETSTNKSSPKLPGFEEVEKKVLDFFPNTYESSHHDVAKVVYNFIAGKIGR